MATNTSDTSAATSLDGKELPQPGTWQIDPSHSDISFTARHMMISKVRGHFRQFTGTILVADPPEQSSVEAVIDAASIDTGDPQRDAHLRSADFLDVEKYPHVTFHSTSVRRAGNRFEVTGRLRLRDVTRTVTLSLEYCGVAVDPWGKTRAAFLASTEINREDFEITWNQALEAGGFLVGKGVKIEIDVEAVRDADE
jgi:polyisoprenoid-binding protein YceI